ncbi:MAG: hypothetical protein ABI158_12795 [Edaphobacter sp.]
MVALCGTYASAQTPAGSLPGAASAQAPATPSAMLQPGLDKLQQALGVLRTDKWKTSGAEREEANTNIASIRNDLETVLPSLLTAADGAPGSVAQVLPAYRNVEALYDVLLRVSEAGRLSAPSQQSAALEEARASLEDGRRALGESLQAAALKQEQQVHTLQAAIRAVPPAPAPVACPPPPPVKKHRPRKKVVKKPAPAPANSQSGAATSH